VFGLGSDYQGRWQKAFFALLLLAGLCFLGALILGWLVARLLSYEQPQIAEFDRLLSEGWDDDLDSLRLYIADGIMAALSSARQLNDRKANLYEKALVLLTAGAFVVGVELGLVVFDKILG
jgi:hypothetical protein